MNSLNRWARRGLLTAVFMVGLSVAACYPSRIGTSWGALTTVGDQQDILFAYNANVVLVDPATGHRVEMKQPNGDVMVDKDGKTVYWQLAVEGTSSEFFSSPISVKESTPLSSGQSSTEMTPVAAASAHSTPEATPQAEATQQVASVNLSNSAGNTLYVATYDSKELLKVDLDTAQITRRIPLGGHVLADVAATPDSLYITFSEEGVVALNTSDLSERWRSQTVHGVWSKPLVVDNTVYFSSVDHNLYAVDAREGNQLWKVDLEGAVTSTPVYHDGHLYVGSLARKVFDITTDGKKTTLFETHDWVWGSPVLVDGVLYVADMGGYIYALDTKQPSSQPKEAHPATMGIRPTPVVTADAVVVASRDGKVYWLKRSDFATVIDTEDVGAEILSDMLVIPPNQKNITEPILVVSTVAQDKLMIGLALNSGRQLWKYPQ